jgi:hypothetical protein
MVIAGLAVIALVAVIAMARSRSISDADMREARTVVKQYLDAYQRHDGQAICAALIPKVREEIARSNDPRACAQELSRRSRLALVVPRVRPRATVVRTRDAGRDDGISVTLEWPDGSAADMGMQRVGDRWLLDSDQTCVTPNCQP